MPPTQKDETRKFFSINEVSEMFNLPSSTLRYWEREFPTMCPRKTGGRSRIYSEEDIEEIRLINDLVKVRNMKISTARDYINKNRKGARSSSDLINRMLRVREQLMAIRNELDSLV